MRSLKVLILFVLLGVPALGTSCTSAIECDETTGISTTKLNPNGSNCSKTCNCNNQNYFGDCVAGKCVSFAREDCKTRGLEQPCRIPSAIANGCVDGIQVCQPEGLLSLRWGRCKCRASTEPKEENPRTETLSPDAPSVDTDEPGPGEIPIDAGEQASVEPTDAGEPAADRTPDEPPTSPDTEPMTEPTDGGGEPLPDQAPTEEATPEPPPEPMAPEPTGEVAPEIATEPPPEPRVESTPEVTMEATPELAPEGGPSTSCTAGATRSCYSGPFGTAGVGLCKAGVQTCDASGTRWGACTGEVTPRYEICDGTDRDCDGTLAPATSSGTFCVTTVAGQRSTNFQDGPASKARFDFPQRLAIDKAGNIYIADTKNHRIRKLDLASGRVTTFAGTGVDGKGDGPADRAQFYEPSSMIFDAAGSLYIADTNNNRIRKIVMVQNSTCGSTSSYTGPCVTTLAGEGFPAHRDSTDPLQARFNRPYGLAFDKVGNLYVADSGNHRIRKIDKAGMVTTLAGNGTAGFADGSATSAQFSTPRDLVFDAAGNLYVADTNNNRIRKLDTAGNVSTFAGTGATGHQDGPGASARFYQPYSLRIDTTGNLYVADYLNHCIRKIDKTGNVSTIAGKGGAKGLQDGSASQARFSSPRDVALDGKGNYYIADFSNHKIRKLDTKGDVTTVAGTGSYRFQDGPAHAAIFHTPQNLAFDSNGNLYIADYGSHRIRKLDPVSGNVTTVAGTGESGLKDGPALQAKFFNPTGLAFDTAGNLYIADSFNGRIRKLDTSGNITTFAGASSGSNKDGPAGAFRFKSPRAIRVDISNGDLYVADTNNHRIRKVTMVQNSICGTTPGYTGPCVITVAGSSKGPSDGTAMAAQFNAPHSIALDGNGNIYVADYSNYRIRKIDTNGLVTTVAGTGSQGYADGPALSAQFRNPNGIQFVSPHFLYITEFNGQRIRKIDLNTKQVSTLAGTGAFGFIDGPTTIAQFATPNDLIFDKKGNLYVSQKYNIRKILLVP